MRQVETVAIHKARSKLPDPGIHLFFSSGSKLTQKQAIILAIHQHTLIFNGSGKSSGVALRFLRMKVCCQNLDALSFPKCQRAGLG